MMHTKYKLLTWKLHMNVPQRVISSEILLTPMMWQSCDEQHSVGESRYRTDHFTDKALFTYILSA